MKALDHYRKGEAALVVAEHIDDPAWVACALARAQAHFTAALAACAMGLTVLDPTGPEPLPARDAVKLADELHAEHHTGIFVPTLDSCSEHTRAEYEALARGLLDREPPPARDDWRAHKAAIRVHRDPAVVEHAHHAHPVAGCPYCEGTEPEGFHP